MRKHTQENLKDNNFHDSVDEVYTPELKDSHSNKSSVEDNFLLTLMDNLPDLIYFKDSESRFLKVNKAYLIKVGAASEDDIIGKTDFDLFGEEHAKDAKQDEEQIIRTGIPIIDKVEKETWRSGKITWASTTKIPLRDKQGNIIGTFGVSRDITERIIDQEEKQNLHKLLLERNKELENAITELQKMQKYLVREEKLASIGQLVAGIAHEINNPLAFISSNLNRFSEYFLEFVKLNAEWAKLGNAAEKNEAYKEMVKNLRELEQNTDTKFLVEDFNTLMKHTQSGTERIRKIVEQLRGFTRLSDLTLGEANINDALEETLSIVWNEVKYKAEVKKEYGKIPRIVCNIGELKQIFVNLLVNAAQSINTNGIIFIRTSANDKQVEIEIEDNGSGIAPENITKIFEPFFTTKEVGKGTGLGLWVTNTIIQKHDGKINVESKLGKGTKFTILLPIKR